MKPASFVAGEERVFERRLARRVAVIGVGHDGANEFFGVAALAEEFLRLRGMFRGRGRGRR